MASGHWRRPLSSQAQLQAGRSVVLQIQRPYQCQKEGMSWREIGIDKALERKWNSSPQGSLDLQLPFNLGNSSWLKPRAKQTHVSQNGIHYRAGMPLIILTLITLATKIAQKRISYKRGFQPVGFECMEVARRGWEQGHNLVSFISLRSSKLTHRFQTQSHKEQMF